MTDEEIAAEHLARLTLLASKDVENFVVQDQNQFIWTYVRISTIGYQRANVTPLLQQWSDLCLDLHHRELKRLGFKRVFAHPRWFEFLEKWKKLGIDLDNNCLIKTNDDERTQEGGAQPID